MERITEYFKGDKLAELLGIELIDVAPGRARTRLRLADHHMNAADTAHGGAIFTLAACAFFAAANSHGPLSLGINAGITFIKAVRGGTLIAEAVEDSITPKLGSYKVTVKTEQDELIATFQGLAYRKSVRRAAHRR
jgi:acyl-CoA thioesterase